ncbi:hypothetical protein AMAG_10368 [Allomyces macrogynus ATCC 38327]|uniref:Fungal lipase-type domain-containing protein n=1 Tax=Allomyces macrogynus (strain ATCC 38327) TaxID=578462 RepID=A0A0L0SUV7_ALLM3|nr:hypothetical protein AMAG_10368 [Allomyces macrogynus ATCC 38327]|eukprot:KNE66114.1 hypothetical protein AMAG_10368 [Allomyces macrogynus ATCC 38327]
MALFGGTGLLVTILLCVLVSLGYTKTQVKLGPLTWLVLFAGTFYAFLILSLLWTLVRTAARLAILIWAAPLVQSSNCPGDLAASQTPAFVIDGNIAVFRPANKTHFALYPLVLYLTAPVRRAQVIVDRCVEKIVHLIDAYQTRKNTAFLTQDERASSTPTSWSSPLLQSSTLSTRVDANAPSVLKSELLPLSEMSFDDKGQCETSVDQFDTLRSTATTNLVMPEVLRNKAQERSDLKDRVRSLLNVVFCLIVIMILAVIMASVEEWLAIVTHLPVVVVATATITVVAVNAICRFARCLSFVALMLEGSLNPDRRRAMYVASTGQDTLLNIFDSLVEQVLRTLVVTLVMCFVSPTQGAVPTAVTLGSAMVVLLVFRLRLFLRFFRPATKFRNRSKMPTASTSQARSPTGYYNGQRWFEPAVVCIVRVVVLALGLTGLALIDLTGIHDPTTPTSTSLADVAQKWDDPTKTANVVTKFGYLAAFVACYFLMDVALLVMRIPHRITVLMLAVSFVGKIVFAALIAHQHTGLLSMAVLVLAYTSFDLRDGKAFWTGGSAQNSVPVPAVRRLRRARIQARVVIGLIAAAMAVSMLIGFTVGKLRAIPVDTNHFEFQIVTQPYSHCHFKFDGRYSLVDFVTLAGAMYKPTASAALALVHQNPALRDSEIWYESPSDAVVRFREFRFSRAPNVSVIAIRGTANMGEVWESVHMWSTPLFITASTYLGTLAAVWPRDVTASLVAFLARNVVFSNFLYVRGVERYVVENITRREPDRTVYLTGHSLGGGVAQIVGSRLGMQAVAVSSPGLGKSFKNYDTSIDALAQWAINVVPLRDPICMIDEQVSGLVLVPCYQRDAPHDCHMWSNTLRTLVASCAGKLAPGQSE